MIAAIRGALAETLQGMFLETSAVLAAAIALSLFLSEVRLRAHDVADAAETPHVTGREVLVTVADR